MKAKAFYIKSKAGRILQHILFWIAVLVFFTFVYTRLSGNATVVFSHLLATLPIYMGATYYTLYFIIPRFLLKKDYKNVIIHTVYVILASAYLEIVISILLIFLPVSILNGEKSGDFNSTSLDIYLRLIGIMGVVFFASTIKVLKHWYISQKENQLLITEKLEAELSFLKSQIHPHFLFNTLNNLYALTLKKSDKSPEVVLKLSEILNYILYECNEDSISLEKEITVIKNYISLEELRYGNRLKVNFVISGNSAGKKITPLIFFPLVENSFKHGASKNNEESKIDINLEISFKKILFVISNTKPKMKMLPVSGGIGLTNVKKRLEMIYKKRYTLKINDKSECFEVKLEIVNEKE